MHETSAGPSSGSGTARTEAAPDARRQTPVRPCVRSPRAEDAAAIWRLVRESDTLDLNSPYAYLLLCTDFSDTALLAEAEGRLQGFVLGYRPPRRPDALFVWQVGVAASCRRRGLGLRLLDALVARQREPRVRYLEATVTPGNRASAGLFRAFARRRAAICRDEPVFTEELFPGGEHEEERLLRIGPLPPITAPEEEN